MDEMRTFKQFVTELAGEDVTIPPVEIEEMTKRFGNKVLQMGHLREDDSMLAPVDCIIEAIRSLESHTITEAAESINNEQMVSLLESGEVLVEKVAEPEKKIARKDSHIPERTGIRNLTQQWKQIEKEVFGVDYPD
jgi:hypothetical protein